MDRWRDGWADEWMGTKDGQQREGERRMGSWEPDNAELASQAAHCTARCFWCIYLLVTSFDGLDKMFIHKAIIYGENGGML